MIRPPEQGARAVTLLLADRQLRHLALGIALSLRPSAASSRTASARQRHRVSTLTRRDAPRTPAGSITFCNTRGAGSG